MTIDLAKGFASDKELSKIRTAAGEMLETGTVTMTSSESFIST